MSFLDYVSEIYNYLLNSISILRIGMAVVIILFAVALRNIIVKFLLKLLRRLADRTKTTVDNQILDVIEKPLLFAFVVLGVQAAFWILNLPQSVDDVLSKVITALYVFSFFWAAYRASGAAVVILEKVTVKTETKIDDMLLPLMKNGIRVFVVVIGVIEIIQIFGADIAGLLTGLGLGGLAFALAAKDTASNLFGSITIMIDKPFTIGDWIMTPHVEGTVEDMGFRSTKIRTFAQALVSIPNSVLSNDTITNWSRMGKRRISYKLGLTHDTTAAELEDCIKRIRLMLQSHPGIHPQTTLVYFEGFGESALQIMLYFFTKTTMWQEFLEVQQDVNLRIKNIVDDMKLSIAFPSQSIYLKSTGNERQLKSIEIFKDKENDTTQ